MRGKQMKRKFKITKSQIINRILILNLVILLVFSIFITLNSLIFAFSNEKVKNERANRDTLAVSYVYRNLYTEVNACYSEYKNGGELSFSASDPDFWDSSLRFLEKIKNLNPYIDRCYFLVKDRERAVADDGFLSVNSLLHSVSVKKAADFETGLYSDGGVKVYQAAREEGGQVTGIVLFVSSYKDTALVLSYTIQTLNEMLLNSVSELGSQATLMIDNEVVCSTFPTTVNDDGTITVTSKDFSDYVSQTSSIHGTDFDIVYYKYVGGYDAVNRNMIFVSVIFICLLIVIDLMIYLSIRKNFYNPLKKILSKHAVNEPLGFVNEYAALDSMVTELQDKYISLFNSRESIKDENSFMRMYAGAVDSKLLKIKVPYAKYVLVKVVIDSGKDNSVYYQKLEAEFSGERTYKRLTINDKLSFFILDASYDGMVSFSVLDKENVFYLAGLSKKSSGEINEPLEQCEEAFACAGVDNRVVFYHGNLNEISDVNVSKEILDALLNSVVKGNIASTESLLNGIFAANKKATVGQMKTICSCLADLLHITSINTNTPVESFKNFYTIRDTYNYEELYRQLLMLYRETAQQNFEKNDSRIADIVKCVDEEYNTQISLNSLSEQFNMPMDQISKLFKKQTGVNFVNYKQQKRIEKAKEMLLEDKSVNEIYQYLGFSHPSTFIKLFEKSVGVTPGKYKQHIKEKGYNQRME